MKFNPKIKLRKCDNDNVKEGDKKYEKIRLPNIFLKVKWRWSNYSLDPLRNTFILGLEREDVENCIHYWKRN